MRDFALLLVLLASLPLCLLRPYVGIYLWFWVSLMNPHRLTYGFMYTFPAAMIIGAATLIGFFMRSEERRVGKECRL